MVSASATKWIMQMMQPIIDHINAKNIGQLWFHHPEKSGKAQHGVGARNWGLTLELMGVPFKARGIGFNLIFPGKKKDDIGGDNPDFNPRSIQFNKDEDGVSRWVTGPPVTGVDANKPSEGHRPNESAPIAMDVFRELVKNKPDAWIPSGIGSEWCERCIAAGISSSPVRAHQIKAFIRARNHLIEQRQLERNVENGCVRLFQPIPPEPDPLEPDSPTIGSA
jgi:hypothetical protein